MYYHDREPGVVYDVSSDEVSLYTPLHVDGLRRNGLVARFVVKGLSAVSFSACSDELLRKGEEILFSFANFGSVYATFLRHSGKTAHFSLIRTLSAQEINRIVAAPTRQENRWLSVSCGVSRSWV